MMGKQTLKDRIKEFIAGVAFEVFLWASNLNRYDYFDAIYYQEKAIREVE
jgi:hypothetical protein